jgi:hypothetical protein
LLATTGSAFLSVDDDTVAEAGHVGATRGGTALVGAGEDPREMWFFPDHDAVLVAAPPGPFDFAASHEELLGTDIRECLREDVGLDGITFTFAQRLISGGRVRVTQAGIMGDSGMSSPGSLLSRRGATRERLVAVDDASYRAAYSARQLIAAVPRKLVTDGPFCMSATLGLDNRDLLPPFMPTMRGEDTIFGLTIARCLDGAWMGHVPAAVLHRPVESRQFATDAIWRDAGRVPFKQIMWACVAAAPFGASDSDDASRLRTLGRWLAELGTRPAVELDEVVRVMLWRQAAQLMRGLEEQLATHRSTPSYWATDIRRSLDTLRAAVVREDYGAPYDLDDDVERARGLARHLIRDFGDLLVAWPELVASAERLNADGRSIAAPIVTS